jgi:hypothetical protein
MAALVSMKERKLLQERLDQIDIDDAWKILCAVKV